MHVTTWPAKPHEPTGDVTFVTMNCAGTVSETVSVAASDGPPFATVSV